MDILIAVLQSLISAVLGILGFVVSVKTNWGRKMRVIFAIAFTAACLSGVGLAIWAGVRTVHANNETLKSQMGDGERPPFVSIFSLPGNARFLVVNASSQPAYGVRIRLQDITVPDKFHDWNYEEMPAHSALMDDDNWAPTGPALQHRFFGQISARTGVYIEDPIILPTENGQWMRAARVRQGDKVLEEEVDSNWPRDNKGKVLGWN